jgi:hypothetical protein
MIGGPTVIIIDGPDGGGKSTLIEKLFETYSVSHVVTQAPRLGEFLPCGDDSERFKHWVTTSSVHDVNQQLLTASSKRLAIISSGASAGVILVDRGPATVLASCIARVSQACGLSPDDAEHSVLAAAIPPLYPETDMTVLPVLCSVNRVETILERCADDAGNQHYREYLKVLFSILRPGWRFLSQHLVVSGEQSLNVATSKVTDACARR